MALLFASDYVISDLVIASNDDFVARIVGYEEDYWSGGFRVEVENKSTRDMFFTMDLASCCGIGVGSFFYLEVPAGETNSELANFSLDDLYFWGIDDLYELSFIFKGMDDNWFFDGPFFEERVTVYPTGLDASSIPVLDYSKFDSGDVILDDGDFKVALFYGEEYCDYFGPGCMVAVWNKCDVDIYATADAVSVCGIALDPLWSLDVPKGLVGSALMTFDEENMALWGLSDIDEISFNFKITDGDSWFGDDLVDEWFTVYPTGLDAASVVYPVYEFSPEDTVVVDNEYCLMVVLNSLAYYDEFFEDYTLPVYIESRYDGNLSIEWEDVKVDGCEIDPYLMEILSGGLKMITDAYFGGYELEPFGIKKPSNIQFTVTVSDDDAWLDLVEESFSVDL